eukprot:3875219-Pleurochrysis_carterae.AAC.6
MPRCPSSLGFGSPSESLVGGVFTAQIGQGLQSRGQSRRDQQRRILLSGGAEGALWEGDGRCAGVGLECAHFGHEPDGRVAFVVFQHVFGAGGARRTKQGGGPTRDLICLSKLGCVLWRHVGQAHDVVAITSRGRSSVFGVGAGEKSGYGERGARR